MQVGGEAMNTDDAIATIPYNYRLYTVDASIEGRVRVMLALQGADEKLWHETGKVLDAAGRDVRPKLYATGWAATLADAVLAAVKDIVDA